MAEVFDWYFSSGDVEIQTGGYGSECKFIEPKDLPMYMNREARIAYVRLGTIPLEHPVRRRHSRRPVDL